MDPHQPVVFQLLESLKESYTSNDFKTCQQLLGQLKEIVDQKESLHGEPKLPPNPQEKEPKLPLAVNPNPQEKEFDQTLDEFLKLPLAVNPDPQEKEFDQTLDEFLKLPLDMGSLEDFTNMTFDGEWFSKTNWEDDKEVDAKEEDAKEDEKEDEEEDANEEEEHEEEDEEEEKDDSDDEEYLGDEEEEKDDSDDEEYLGDEEEDEDDDEEIQPLRRSKRIKNATK